MIEVDGMGKFCPAPIILTKKAMSANTQNENILVRVDNEVATENLVKMATQMNIRAEVTKQADREYEVLFYITEGISLGDGEECQIINDPLSVATLGGVTTGEYVVIINSDQMGTGDSVFGEMLLESFIYALVEQERTPKMLICYNSGVRLTAENEKTIKDLKALEAKGCEILSCGLCLDFYSLTEALSVGSITNMYRIVEIMRSLPVVRP